MANERHEAIIKQGAQAWAEWSKTNVGRGYVHPDLSHAKLAHMDLRGVSLYQANLHGADLYGANLNGADLRVANLEGAYLQQADLREAQFREVNLCGANLSSANLERVNLSKCNLSWVNFSHACLAGADLTEANLGEANFTDSDLTRATLRKARLYGVRLVNTNVDGTDLSGCYVHGLSAWRLRGDPRDQSGLIITPPGESEITVDSLEVGQFLYLLLTRKKLRDVLDTITSKAVLVLGRFTPERKAVLEAIAEELRKHNLLPIIFDFERSTARDFTETIKVLAGMCLFVIADITNPKSSPLELQATVPDYQIPFVAIIQENEKPFSMFKDLLKYSWVLKPVITYPSTTVLIKAFKKAIIEPALQKHTELLRLKSEEISTKSAMDFLSANT